MTVQAEPSRGQSSCDSWHSGRSGTVPLSAGALAAFLQRARPLRRPRDQARPDGSPLLNRSAAASSTSARTAPARTGCPAAANASASRSPAISVLEWVRPSAAAKIVRARVCTATACSPGLRVGQCQAQVRQRHRDARVVRSEHAFEQADAPPVRLDRLRRPALQAQGVAELVEGLGGVGVVRSADSVNAAIAARWWATASSSRPASCSTMPSPAVAWAQPRSSRRPCASSIARPERSASLRSVQGAAAPQGVAEVDQHLGLQIGPPGTAQHVKCPPVGDDGRRGVVGAVEHMAKPVVGVREHDVVRVERRL